MAMTNAIQNAAAKKTAPTTEAPTAVKSARGQMQDYVTKMLPEIKKALPRVMTPERFSRIVLSALSTTPTLAECTPSSFLGAMMTAAQLGVEPNTPLGQGYLIPRRNGKKGGIWECQFQLG